MRVLFLHQNAPGQFRHLAPHLARDTANQVVFLGQRSPAAGDPLQSTGVRWLRYPAPQPPGQATHQYLHRMEGSVRRGQSVARAVLALGEQGFTPDVVVAHPGWGEAMFLRDVLPRAALLSYCEMFYQPKGQDTGYVPEITLDLNGRCRLRAWNADLLTALDIMDRGIAPTAWQRAQHPDVFQPRIAVVHDGIDTSEAAPDRAARFTLPDGRALTAEDEVVTYVARHLEPVRGFPVLMRALPALLRRRPNAQVVICGEDGVSYGRPPPHAGTWREAMLREVTVDPARIHFVGRLSRPAYLSLLQVSALHLYLTVPFVLSWSFVEALSAGCLMLGSDVAPVREALHEGVNGFLVDGRDADAVARRAAELLAHRAALGPVRDRARATATQRFDLRHALQAQTRLIRELGS